MNIDITENNLQHSVFKMKYKILLNIIVLMLNYVIYSKSLTKWNKIKNKNI